MNRRLKITLLIVPVLLFFVYAFTRYDAGNKVEVKINAETIAKGKSLYLTDCAPCHGSEGKGNGPVTFVMKMKPRNHTDRTYMDKLSNEHLFKIIRSGGSFAGYPQMLAYPNLSDDDIKNLIAFMRSIEK